MLVHDISTHVVNDANQSLTCIRRKNPKRTSQISQRSEALSSVQVVDFNGFCSLTSSALCHLARASFSFSMRAGLKDADAAVPLT